jgi:hypothetical protein
VRLEIAARQRQKGITTERRFKSERAYKPDSVFTAKSHRGLEDATPSLDAEAIIPLGRRSLDGSMRPTRGLRENAEALSL